MDGVCISYKKVKERKGKKKKATRLLFGVLCILPKVSPPAKVLFKKYTQHSVTPPLRECLDVGLAASVA